ncbi:glycosyltransferase family 2 protein [bacterium]|nr:glycosyltransferase family 2 protein [bacterium]
MTPETKPPVPPTETPPVWSVIIPMYNEENRIGPSLQAVVDFMDQRSPSYEILVVDDGSTDASVAFVRQRFPHVRLLLNPGNRGKGYSVRAGLLASKGRWRLFSDADLSTPIEEIARFEKELTNGADVVIGSRALPESILEVRQAWWREISGRLFNKLVRLVSGLPFHDTQCGFKAYTAEAAKHIASLQRLEGWAFDVEHLHLARKMGLDVREIPVRWLNSADSRIHFLRDASRMLIDVIRIRLSRYSV